METIPNFSTSESTDKLMTAIAEFQGDVETIRFDESADVPTRSGGSYSYKYASLSTIIENIQEFLAKHKIAVMQFPIGRFGLLTRISVGEQFIQAISEMESESKTPQAIGSTITYQKRYAIVAALRLAVADEDDNAAEGSKKPNTKVSNAKEKTSEKKSDKKVKMLPVPTAVQMKKLLDRIDVAAPDKRKELHASMKESFMLTIEQNEQIEKAIANSL